MTDMGHAVQIGAGNIGRGFMGQIYFDSGWCTTFIDVDEAVVDMLNERRQYTIEMVDNSGTEVHTIRRVEAVSGLDREASARVLAAADVVSISVGVNALPKVAPTVAAGLQARWASRAPKPLNILLCENLLDAPRVFRDFVREHLTVEEQAVLDARVGFVETSIGRMVPGSPDSSEDPLAVRVEPYCRLPVDRQGFVGEIPNLKYLEPFSPFVYHIERKLFVHNCGHAVLAYLGWAQGLTYVWEAVESSSARELCQLLLSQIGRALSREHDVSRQELDAYAADLIARFGNRGLGDTVARVGADPVRKLGPRDRIVGAYRLLEKQGDGTAGWPMVFAAALNFAPAGDDSAERLQAMLQKEGTAAVLTSVCGFSDSEAAALAPPIDAYRRELVKNPGAAIADACAAIRKQEGQDAN